MHWYSGGFSFTSADIPYLAQFNNIERLAFRELDDFADLLGLGMSLISEVRSLNITSPDITHLNGIGAFQNVKEFKLVLRNN